MKASQNPRKPKNIKPSGCPGESSKFANSDFTPPSVGQGSVGQGSVVQGSQRSAVAQNEAGESGGHQPPRGCPFAWVLGSAGLLYRSLTRLCLIGLRNRDRDRDRDKERERERE